ncbi:MAG: 4Fe-4S binding protein [Campylobacteraceae bacterium]|jgi:ferredoxin-type protein NapF|nr:4Fe-4S binding protein [Campylobacteraceae bacterium]
MNRRELFSSLIKKTGASDNTCSSSLLPYVKDTRLLSICAKCSAPCLKACDENIIILKNGVPLLNFEKGGCTFCKKCAKSCNKNVLDENMPPKIDVKISIKTTKCLSWKNVMCFACKDACKAILFFGMFRPTINEQICTKCGKCINLCPQNAILALK